VAKAHQARHLKLESGVGTGAGRWTPEELGNRYEPAESMMEAEEDKQMLLHRLERLDLRERTVLALRYGLEGELPLTLKEIGHRLGVTREWVRKIEIRAVRRLHSEDDDRGVAAHAPVAGQSVRRARRPAPAAVSPVKSSFAPKSARAKAPSRSSAPLSVSRRAQSKSVASPPSL
jgi:hypothetical protein